MYRFDTVINSLLKEEELSDREKRIETLKTIEDINPVILAFAGVYINHGDSVSVNEPWQIITTYPGTQMYDKYFKGVDVSYCGVEIKVIREVNVHMHSARMDVVFALLPKKEGEHWYRKMELIRGEEYLADDGESVVIDTEGDPITGWTEKDEIDWADWVKDWVHEMD